MNICIVGAGPTGLAAGYELAKKGHSVSIYDSEAEYARLLGTIQVGDKKLEKFYHHIFTSYIDIIDLIDELDLSSELSWISAKNGIYLNNRLYPFSSPADLFLFKELCFTDRISLGILLLKAQLIKKWGNLEDITAKEWVIKHAGRNVYQKVWAPLLYSKFDQDADEISAAWLWNRIKLRGSTRSKTLKSELLGYLNGSFLVIYEKMASRIEELGGTIGCSKSINRIVPRDDRSLDVTCKDETKNFKAVIITSAPAVVLDMGLQFPIWYIEKIKKIKYKANICMILELSEQLSPFYWIAVAEKDFPFVAIIEHTNLVPINGYNCHVVYLSRYIDEKNELFLSPDEKVKELFIKYLKRTFPKWDESTIIKTHLNRARYVQPVIFTGYSEIVPQFKTPIDNLYLARMAQIYPEDRGQNYAVKMGEKIARIVDSSSLK
jgi:protoporphyrinogen oxidase